MLLKNEEGKLTFIVDTLCSIGFENRGGSIAVHKLAYELANRGHIVYVFDEPCYPHENINTIPTSKTEEKGNPWDSEFSWEPFAYDLHKTVSIYNQNTWHNPFGTIHTCRWILHDDHEKWKSYDETDLIYNYGSFFVPKNIKQQKLIVTDYKLETYTNKNSKRNGFCFINHKYTPDWGLDFVDKFNAKNLTSLMLDGKFSELSDEFNKFEYLVTFDSKSYITAAAALCGCKSIILNPDKNTTPLEYRLNNPLQMFGVAYGLADLKWANDTVGMVRNHLEELEKIDQKTINSFVQYWEEKLL